MGQAKSSGLLAFSAILTLGSVLGWTKPVVSDRPLQPGALEQVSGKGDQAGTAPRVAEPAEAGRDGRPAAGKQEMDPRNPAHPESEADSPAREEKNDCDDCVIVLPEGVDEPTGATAGSSGMAGAGQLAGTLWGLFMVARPKRLPRTIIRGVTVP